MSAFFLVQHSVYGELSEVVESTNGRTSRVSPAPAAMAVPSQPDGMQKVQSVYDLLSLQAYPAAVACQVSRQLALPRVSFTTPALTTVPLTFSSDVQVRRVIFPLVTEKEGDRQFDRLIMEVAVAEPRIY
jgi:hypothetical protein